MQWWPTAGLRGELSQELLTPAHFQQAVKTVNESDLPDGLVLGNDVQETLEAIEKFTQAGFDRIYLHHIGPDQDTFCDFFEMQLKPKLPGGGD